MKSKMVRGKRKKEATGVVPLFLIFYFLLFTSSCGSGKGAVAASATMGTCPVCKMKVNATDEWAAEIYFKDGMKLMFESPGDMLAFYTSPGSYGVGDAHKDRNNIERIAVKDYQTKQAIDARHAKLAYRTKVEGPMGPDFLPFGKTEDAEAFVAVNGGDVLSLSEVTGDMIRDLRK